eukprot:363893-Chlamydomonas_euryale.AAC.2
MSWNAGNAGAREKVWGAAPLDFAPVPPSLHHAPFSLISSAKTQTYTHACNMLRNSHQAVAQRCYATCRGMKHTLPCHNEVILPPATYRRTTSAQRAARPATCTAGLAIGAPTQTYVARPFPPSAHHGSATALIVLVEHGVQRMKRRERSGLAQETRALRLPLLQ